MKRWSVELELWQIERMIKILDRQDYLVMKVRDNWLASSLRDYLYDVHMLREEMAVG